MTAYVPQNSLLLSKKMPCASQVPLRTFFALDQGLPTDVAAVRMGAANATDFGFIDVHMYPSELHRLRNTNFAALWAGNDVVNVRWNGAVWNHLVLNDHLWPVAERYGLQKLSKRQVRPSNCSPERVPD